MPGTPFCISKAEREISPPYNIGLFNALNDTAVAEKQCQGLQPNAQVDQKNLQKLQEIGKNLQKLHCFDPVLSSDCVTSLRELFEANNSYLVKREAYLVKREAYLETWRKCVDALMRICGIWDCRPFDYAQGKCA